MTACTSENIKGFFFPLKYAKAHYTYLRWAQKVALLSVNARTSFNCSQIINRRGSILKLQNFNDDIVK